MNRKLVRNLDNDQQDEFDMNTKRKGEFKMDRKSTSRRFGHQARQTENGSSKKTKATYPNKAESVRRLSHNIGPEGLPADRKLETTIEDLNGTRVRVRTMVDRFGWGYGYQGKREPKIRLKNVRLPYYGDLLVKDQLWLIRGKWAQIFRIGDIIEFEARLKNGELKNPTQVKYVKSGRPDSPVSRTTTPAQLGTENSDPQMRLF